MKINVCVNGSFRYPQYIRHYEAAGVLGAFYYAHRRSTDRSRLHLRAAKCHNAWAKEYALQAAFRFAPGLLRGSVPVALGDLWQRHVIAQWRSCDTVETVIGAVADRVIRHAKAQGSRVLGHPVTAHPDCVARNVGRAYAALGLDPEDAAMPGLERRQAEIAGCDRLLVDSAFVARSFVEAGVPRERIATVRPAVDLLRFTARHPSERDRATFRVVCVGTITPRKGQQVLLEAWRRLRLPQAELVLVGPLGRHAAAVTRGHAGTFTHVPRLEAGDLRALLVGASAFVLASVEDGFAQAPLEAMACGVPAIVTRNVGMAELMEDGVDGFVVDPFDVDGLAARLETLHRDPDRAVAMGVAAAATARRGGSWEAYVGRVIAEHRRMLGQSDLGADAA